MIISPIPTPAMMTMLPYSVSTGSAFSSYDKLSGSSNYVFWKQNLTMTLIMLHQWGIVNGTITAPTTQVPDHPTDAEIKAADNWLVQSTATYAEIIFHVDNDICTTMEEDMGLKELWEVLEKHYSSKQDSLRQALIPKLQTACWNGKGPISAHCDYLVSLHTQIAHTRRKIPDKTFFNYFITSLLKSLNSDIFMYEDQTYNINHFCQKFTKLELQQQAHDVVNGTSDSPGLAMYGGTASGSNLKGNSRGSKGDKGDRGHQCQRRDYSDHTCFRCGKKGHILLCV